jgi:hypothetical protein
MRGLFAAAVGLIAAPTLAQANPALTVEQAARAWLTRKVDLSSPLDLHYSVIGQLVSSRKALRLEDLNTSSMSLDEVPAEARVAAVRDTGSGHGLTDAAASLVRDPAQATVTRIDADNDRRGDIALRDDAECGRIAILLSGAYGLAPLSRGGDPWLFQACPAASVATGRADLVEISKRITLVTTRYASGVATVSVETFAPGGVIQCAGGFRVALKEDAPLPEARGFFATRWMASGLQRLGREACAPIR